MPGRLRAFLVVFAGFDQTLRSQTRVKSRAEIKRMVMLATTTELMGLSVVPPSLVVALLPYMVPNVVQWKRVDDPSAQVRVGC